MQIRRPDDPVVLLKEEELKGFCSLAEFCHGMVLLWVQTLDDKIEVGHFCQQELHAGEMISVCDQTENVPFQSVCVCVFVCVSLKNFIPV